jgi:hypothetical protein
MSDLNFKSTDIQSLRSKFTNEAFLAMKKEFPDEGDESIARFLIARNGDITKTMPFLKASIIWRSENLPIKTNEIVNELKKGKVYLHGQDKNKHALIGRIPSFDSYIYVFVYVCIYIYMYTHIHICVCMSIYIYVYECIHIYVDTYFVHLYLYDMYSCIRIYLKVCIRLDYMNISHTHNTN